MPRNEPGVYVIRHVSSGKVYVGSSFEVKQRWSNHRSELRLGKHCNIHLQRAWDKYGESDFVFDVLEWCLIELLLQREQYWIDRLDAFKSGYNRRPKAESCLGYKYSEERLARHREQFTPEVRAKMAAAKKGWAPSQELRAAVSKRHKGVPLSEEHKRKVGNANRGRVRTEEQKQQCRAARKGKKMPESAKARISQALRSRPPISDETREKLRAAARNRDPAKQRAALKRMLAARGIELPDATAAA